MIKEQKEAHGGWAGIRVPWIDKNNDGLRDEGEEAELNLYGEGTVVAIGGDAGKGNIPTGVYGGRWRSDGAGARDRTETGGKGGNANSTQKPHVGIYSNQDNDDNPETNTNTGWDGEDGEDCGIVKINNEIKVYAYGGAGGEGSPGGHDGAGGGRRIPCCTVLAGGGAGRRSEQTIVMAVVVLLEQELSKIVLVDIMDVVEAN